MTIQEKIDKFNPFFENLVDKLNKEYNVNYYYRPTVISYIKKAVPGYYDIINYNVPCICTLIQTLEHSNLLTSNKVNNFLQKYDIDNIKFRFVGNDEEEIMFVIPINLEDN